MTPEKQEQYDRAWNVVSLTAFGLFITGALSTATWAAFSTMVMDASIERAAGGISAFCWTLFAFVLLASFALHAAEEGQKKKHD